MKGREKEIGNKFIEAVLKVRPHWWGNLIEGSDTEMPFFEVWPSDPDVFEPTRITIDATGSIRVRGPAAGLSAIFTGMTFEDEVASVIAKCSFDPPSLPRLLKMVRYLVAERRNQIGFQEVPPIRETAAIAYEVLPHGRSHAMALHLDVSPGEVFVSWGDAGDCFWDYIDSHLAPAIDKAFDWAQSVISGRTVALVSGGQSWLIDLDKYGADAVSAAYDIREKYLDTISESLHLFSWSEDIDVVIE